MCVRSRHRAALARKGFRRGRAPAVARLVFADHLSCSRCSSACSSASTLPPFAARMSSANSRIAASAWVNARVAQEQARRKPLDGAAHHAVGILRLDLAVDFDAQAPQRAVGGENMGEVAEGILVRVKPRVGGNIDAPADHILAFVVARGEPQHLDHARGRRVVAMDDAVGDANAHIGDQRSEVGIRSSKRMNRRRTACCPGF